MKHVWNAEDVEPGKLVEAKGTDWMIAGYAIRRDNRPEVCYCLVNHYSGVIHRYGSRLRLARKLTSINARPM